MLMAVVYPEEANVVKPPPVATWRLCQDRCPQGKRLGFDDDRPKIVIFEALLP
jgi:hypothetical protein